MNALPYIVSAVLPAAMSMLPERFDSPEARAEIVAIALQESRCEFRRQIHGPALSFWQAESGGGFKGIITHHLTGSLARDLLRRMAYGEADPSDFQAIEDNDILACCGARLLLYTHLKRLPRRGEYQYGWDYYNDVWRPGKPRRETFNAFYALAWNVITGDMK